MSFIEDLRSAQRGEEDARQRETDIIKGWTDRLDSATNLYKEYYKKTGQGNLDTQFAHEKLRDFIYKNGLKDGKWENEDYDELDFQQYGSELLDKLFEGSQTFDDYVTKNGNKSVQGTYKHNKFKNEHPWLDAASKTAGLLVGNATTAMGPLAAGPAAAVFGVGAMNEMKNNNTLDEMYAKYNQEQTGVYDNAFNLVENYDKYADVAATSAQSEEDSSAPASDEGGTTEGGKSDGFSDEETEGDVIEYTYKPGDTFGQVLVDLGLATDKGLWGDDGDVAFYDKQLWAQGAPDPVTGNIPVGTTIKLRRRKV